MSAYDYRGVPAALQLTYILTYVCVCVEVWVYFFDFMAKTFQLELNIKQTFDFALCFS